VPVENRAGRTALPELGGLLQAMDLVVAVDSGPVHMAAAAGTPVLNGAGALLGAAAAAGMTRPTRRRGRAGRLGWTAAALLAGGALLWRLGQPGAAWCRPDAVIGPHSGWHLLVAGALAAGFAYLRSGPDSPEARLLSSEATRQEATGCPDAATT
jgi:hypothetical protein